MEVVKKESSAAVPAEFRHSKVTFKGRTAREAANAALDWTEQNQEIMRGGKFTMNLLPKNDKTGATTAEVIYLPLI